MHGATTHGATTGAEARLILKPLPGAESAALPRYRTHLDGIEIGIAHCEFVRSL